MKKHRLICALVLLLAAVLAGCGGPKADVSIFLMTNGGTAQDTTSKLAQALQAKLGEKPTIAVSGSPIFSMEKLIVEVAAADHSIIIIPEEQFQMLVKQGGTTPLEGAFDASRYPGGVLEVPADPNKPDAKPEKHLYGVPVSDAKLLRDAGYKGKETLYAFVHPRAPHMEQAIQALKAIVEN